MQGCNVWEDQKSLARSCALFGDLQDPNCRDERGETAIHKAGTFYSCHSIAISFSKGSVVFCTFPIHLSGLPGRLLANCADVAGSWW